MYTPKKIIDFHVHCFPDKIAKGAIEKLTNVSQLAPETDGTLSDTIQKLKDWNIDSGVVLNIATRPGQENSINTFSQKINDQFKNTTPSLVSFGSVHPDSPDAIKQLENIKNLGLKGIKMHPDYQKFNANDKKVYPIYEKCKELDLIVVLHTGFDPISPEHTYGTPDMLSQIATDFKGLKFVFAHLGGTNMWNEVFEKIAGLDVCLDLALCGKFLEKNLCEEIIKKHSSEKILFASDLPWYSTKDAMEYLCSLNLTNNEKDNIFYKNAEYLLTN